MKYLSHLSDKPEKQTVKVVEVRNIYLSHHWVILLRPQGIEVKISCSLGVKMWRPCLIFISTQNCCSEVVPHFISLSCSLGV